MNFKSCLEISFYNIIKNKKQTLLLLFNIITITFTLFVVSILSLSISRAYTNILYGSASKNHIELNLELDGDRNIIENKDYDLYKALADKNYTYQSVMRSNIDLVKYLHKENEWSFVNIDFAKIAVDDVFFQAQNDYSYNFVEKSNPKDKSKNTVPFQIQVVNSTSLFFTQNEVDEFEYNYPQQNVLIAGSYPANSNQILVSDYILSRFNITENFENLIGSNISFFVGEVCVLQDKGISGVTNSNIYRVNALKKQPQIIIVGDNETFSNFLIENMVADVPFKDYNHSEDIQNEINKLNLQIKLPETVETFDIVYRLKTIVNKISTLICALVSIAVLLNIFNLIRSNLSEKTNYIGMLKAIGMHKFQVITIKLNEIVLLTFTSSIFSFGISFLIIRLLNKSLGKFIATDLSLNALDFIKLFICVFGLVLLIIFAFQIILSFKIAKLSSSDLLRK